MGYEQRKSRWAPIIERLLSTPTGEYFDLPDFPASEVRKIRMGLQMTKAGRNIRYGVQRLTANAGGIRIIRMGTWGSSFLGIADDKTDKTFWPPTQRQFTIPNGTVHWFNCLLSSAPSVHSSEIKRNKCSIRACVYPAIGDGLCRQHLNFWCYGMSMTDCSIGWSDIRDTEKTKANLSTVTHYDPNRLIFVHKGRTARETLGWNVGREEIVNFYKNEKQLPPAIQISPFVHGMGHGTSKRVKRSQRTKRKQMLKHRQGGKHPEQKSIKRWSRASLSDLYCGSVPESVLSWMFNDEDRALGKEIA